MAYLVQRAPDGLASLAGALGVSPELVGARIRDLGGEPAGLGALGADRAELDRALDSMLVRPELAFTPGPPSREDLEELVEAAW
jgi:alcohol dehydrogenase class IV